MDFFFFQAEDGIRDLVRSRGLGDVYKRQGEGGSAQYGRQAEFHLGLIGVIDGQDHPFVVGASLSLIHI